MAHGGLELSCGEVKRMGMKLPIEGIDQRVFEHGKFRRRPCQWQGWAVGTRQRSPASSSYSDRRLRRRRRGGVSLAGSSHEEQEVRAVRSAVGRAVARSLRAAQAGFGRAQCGARRAAPVGGR